MQTNEIEQLKERIATLERSLAQANEKLQQQARSPQYANATPNKSEKYFRLAVNNIPYTFVIYDANRRYQFVNARGVNLSGYQNEAELLGRTDEELFPPEMTEKYLPALRRARETRTLQTQELEINLPAGTFTKVLTYAPVLDKEGEIQQVLGITHDISALKRTEKRLRLFGRALEASSNGIVITDSLRDDNPIVWVNPAFEHITGYSAGEIMGRNCRFLQGSDRNQPELDEIRAAIHEQRECHAVLRNYRKDGSLFWNELSIAPVQEAGGKVTHFVGIQNDITKRKQAEDNLSRYAQRLSILHKIDQAVLAGQSSAEIAEATLSQLRSLVPCRRVSVILFDYQASEITVLAAQTNGTVQPGTGMRYPMEAFEGLDDILATLRQDKIHALDFMKFARPPPLIQTYQTEGLRYYLCLPLITQDELIGSLNLAVDRLDSVDPEHLDIAREITRQLAVAIQQRRLFEQVQTGREQLQILSRRLLEIQESERRLLARELHDEIGQALTAVKLNLQAMQRLSEKKSRASGLQECIGIVEGALQQVRNLSLDLRPSLLDDLGLGAALRWYADRQAQRGGFNVQVIVDLPGERLPADLETTCFRVAQEAITNVIRHAKAHQVWVQVRRHPSVLQLTIRDDGIGFDVQAARQRAAHGESLGLLSMEERVLLARGKIDIESAPNRGTTIQASLPLTPKQNFIERRTQRRKHR